MTRVKIEDGFFPTTTLIKYRVHIQSSGDEPEGWLSDNDLRTSSRAEARVFDTAEQAKEVAEGFGYKVVD